MSATDIADLAAACQALGRSTAVATRIRELSHAQDGLRLDTLDSDADALSAAAASTQEALDAAASATGVLAQAWRSGTGSAATEFLRRQCASGATVIEHLTAAAGALRRLREELGRQLQTCDAATARIQIPETWLSAARAVNSGRAGADAVDIVTGQIAPFVDTTIAGEWAPAVESATAGMNAAYRQAGAELADRAPVRFETPAMPSAAPSASASAPPVASPAAFAPPQIPSIPTVPEFGVPDLGGALLPLVNAIAAALGGYSGSPAVDDAVDTAAPPTMPGATGPAPKAKPVSPKPKAEPEANSEPEPEPKPAAPVTAPLPPPLAAEAPEPPAPVSPPVQPERTPCEIAADELPQVGA